MYNINWLVFVRVLLASAVRKVNAISLGDVLVSQVKVLHDAFLLYRDETIYKLRFNGQTIYLEKRLNDKWDNIQRGIYIETVYKPVVVRYNKVELKQKRARANKWNVAKPYIQSEYVAYGPYIWYCLTPNTGQVPNTPGYWLIAHPRPVRYNKSDLLFAYDFIVWVPSNVVFDLYEMTALVNFYRIAGKRFIIKIY